MLGPLSTRPLSNTGAQQGNMGAGFLGSWSSTLSSLPCPQHPAIAVSSLKSGFVGCYCCCCCCCCHSLSGSVPLTSLTAQNLANVCEPALGVFWGRPFLHEHPQHPCTPVAHLPTGSHFHHISAPRHLCDCLLCEMCS
jgi:hypothetical protein